MHLGSFFMIAFDSRSASVYDDDFYERTDLWEVKKPFLFNERVFLGSKFSRWQCKPHIIFAAHIHYLAAWY